MFFPWQPFLSLPRFYRLPFTLSYWFKLAGSYPLTVVPEDPDAITNAITSLLDDPALMQELGSKGREFVQQNYHREQLMEQLLRELKDRFSL